MNPCMKLASVVFVVAQMAKIIASGIASRVVHLDGGFVEVAAIDETYFQNLPKAKSKLSIATCVMQ